jgi:hypothetical protein
MTDATIRAIAEAVVELLVERGVVITHATTYDGRVLSATEAARFLGRRRQWVYAHAAELGGFRYGTGRRARLGFDASGSSGTSTTTSWRGQLRGLGGPCEAALPRGQTGSRSSL